MLPLIFRQKTPSLTRPAGRRASRASLSAGALALAATLLTGCVGVGTPPASTRPAAYDFGLLVPLSAMQGDAGANANANTGAEAMGLTLEVRTPPWFDSQGIGYRLAYDDPLKRREYVDSRWAANPGLLLAQRLRQLLGMSDVASGAAATCVLRIELQEFSQVFYSPERSRALLHAAATLTDASQRAIAERHFVIEKPAETPDARGGVGALVEAGNDLGQQLAQWLGALNAQSAGRSPCHTTETPKPRRR